MALSEQNRKAIAKAVVRLSRQGAQGPFAPREGTPFALQFRQIFGELGVSFGLSPRIADRDCELRCPDSADAQQIDFRFRGLACEFPDAPAADVAR